MRGTALLANIAFQLLVAASPSMAEFTNGLINMDFKLWSPHPQTGYALLGTVGDTWNVLSGDANGHLAQTTAVLTLANGNTSNGVTLSLSDSSGAAEADPSGFESTPYARLMGDEFQEFAGGTFTMMFNGLTPFHSYDLYLYSTELGNDNRTTTFTISGISLSVVNSVRLSNFAEGINYVHFGSQPADVAGHISIAMHGSGGGPQSAGVINGFQISDVPEPTSLSLVIVGGTLLIMSRHRRN